MRRQWLILPHQLLWRPPLLPLRNKTTTIIRTILSRTMIIHPNSRTTLLITSMIVRSSSRLITTTKTTTTTTNMILHTNSRHKTPSQSLRTTLTLHSSHRLRLHPLPQILLCSHKQPLLQVPRQVPYPRMMMNLMMTSSTVSQPSRSLRRAFLTTLRCSCSRMSTVRFPRRRKQSRSLLTAMMKSPTRVTSPMTSCPKSQHRLLSHLFRSQHQCRRQFRLSLRLLRRWLSLMTTMKTIATTMTSSSKDPVLPQLKLSRLQRLLPGLPPLPPRSQPSLTQTMMMTTEVCLCETVCSHMCQVS